MLVFVKQAKQWNRDRKRETRMSSILQFQGYADLSSMLPLTIPIDSQLKAGDTCLTTKLKEHFTWLGFRIQRRDECLV